MNKYLLTRCQQKRCEQHYNILKEFVSKRSVFRERQAVKDQSSNVFWIHAIDNNRHRCCTLGQPATQG